ncbi:hypothetical protein C1645_871655 [Glomus cerebriforme]|uniref:BTB/POZ domain-containing protein n=1 Tax=Glomus cerebriforme TaxID=658196 RepID=A0A397TFR9_9GLOM|nr:hypothetical protein C1645_871655 [Glomus cerebriforme]
MTADLTSSLFRDFKKLHMTVEDDDDCDVILKVEKSCFKAHSIILKARSEYLQNLINNENDVSRRLSMILKRNITVEISNISPNVFKICLNYIYTGELSLKEYDNEIIFDLIIAADKLTLIDMVDYIQNHYIEKPSWVKQNFIKVYQTSLNHQNFKKLQTYCKKLIKQDPALIFNSKNLPTLEKNLLLDLIKRDDLSLREIIIWRGLVSWIIEQGTPLTRENIVNWKDSHFTEFERRIKDFIPHIRFFNIPSIEYYDDVHPFKKALPPKLIGQLEEYYLRKTSPPSNALPPRKLVDSTIINEMQIRQLSRWIDGYDNVCDNNCLESKINFILLARGSRNGMTREIFHSLCDDKGPTLILAKVDKTNDIIGGYNPSSWSKSNKWIETTESFIFSFKSPYGNSNNIILSRIINPIAAIWDGDCKYDIGFSTDLQIFNGEYKCENYKKRIMNYDNFKITDYEVFHIKK